MTAEFDLLSVCCAWPVDGRRAARIRQSAEGSLDWERFRRLAVRHRVEAMVFHAAMRAGLSLPPAVSEALKNAAAATLGQNLRLARESIRLRELFEAADIQVLFFKGCSLAMLVYGSLAPKHGKDIDILVARADTKRALALLENDGYVIPLPTGTDRDRARNILFCGRDVPLMRNGTEVELHWQLSDNPFLLRGLDASSSRQPVTLYGASAINTLADEDLFSYLCAHGAQHAWFRLKWLADLNALLSARDEATIMAFWEGARRSGTDICASLALILCERLFGLPVPAKLTATYSWRVRLLCAFATNIMAGPYSEAEPYDWRLGTTPVALSQFLLGRGWKFFGTQCGIALTSRHDRLKYPLPAALRFLYPLLRLPLWIGRRIAGIDVGILVRLQSKSLK